MAELFDAIVVGGGPAGAATAGLMARGGLRVLCLERDRFPRFHVGESLVPSCMPILGDLGVDFRSDLRKGGAEFRDEAQGLHQVFPFSDALPGCPSHAYQVERARFDAQLLERAQALGASVRQDCEVEGIAFESDHAVAHTAAGAFTGRVLVDATGAAARLGRAHRALRPVENVGRAAVFSHLIDVDEDAYAEAARDGNVVIFRVPIGWAWLIPLSGRRASVGVVRREGVLREDDLRDTISGSPLLSALARGSTLLPPRRVGNYGFVNQRSCGTRFVCVGDARGFVDPIFSTGIALALEGAKAVAGHASAVLGGNHEGEAEADPGAWAAVATALDPGYRVFFAMIHRFYNGGLLDNVFLRAPIDADHRRAVTTILAGDVWRDDNPVQQQLSMARRDGAHAEWERLSGRKP